MVPVYCRRQFCMNVHDYVALLPVSTIDELLMLLLTFDRIDKSNSMQQMKLRCSKSTQWSGKKHRTHQQTNEQMPASCYFTHVLTTTPQPFIFHTHPMPLLLLSFRANFLQTSLSSHLQHYLKKLTSI
jgi:hypothetical protein